MITCSVCGQRNDDLAVLCTSCKSYLQSKVDNLNLFETIWQLIESPRAAHKKIVLARHKNYVLLLSCLLGMSLTFALFWLWNLGARFDNVLMLLGVGGLMGIPLGVGFVLVSGMLIVGGIRLLGGKASLKNSGAVVSYASMPLSLSLVLILPLEIAIFGNDFFGTNPPPMIINPVVYVALLGFDALAILWSILLLYQGVTVLSGFGKLKSIGVTLMATLIPATLSFGLKTI